MHRIELHITRVLSRNGDIVAPYQIMIYRYRSTLMDQFLVANGVPLSDMEAIDSPVDFEHSERGANLPRHVLIEKIMNIFTYYRTDADIALKVDRGNKISIPRSIILANGDDYRKTFSQLLDWFMKPVSKEDLRKRRQQHDRLKEANDPQYVPYKTQGEYII